MNLATACVAAEALVDLLEGSCERIEIAGSVRREKAKDSKDVELVLIPRFGIGRPSGELFEREVNLAMIALEGAMAAGANLQPIKPGVPVSPPVPWPLKEDAKYWRLWLPNLQASADLFLCTPETWGYNKTIRTGSADFSHGLAYRWTTMGGHCAGARFIRSTGEKVETPTERSVFDLLEIEWVEPQHRLAREQVRSLRREVAL